MRLLTAGRLDGEVDTGIAPGEVVYPCFLHDADLAVETGVLCRCGCAVSFAGLVTGRATSVAVCRDIDVTEASLAALVAGALAGAAGRRVDDEALDLGTETARTMVLAGAAFQPGEVVFRLGARLTSRERPERGLGEVIRR